MSPLRPFTPGRRADRCACWSTAPAKLSGPDEWLVEKHGTQRRRAWRKLHLGVDAETGTIVASTLTGKEVDDAAELGPLLKQVDAPLAAVVANGAYDQDQVWER